MKRYFRKCHPISICHFRSLQQLLMHNHLCQLGISDHKWPQILHKNYICSIKIISLVLTEYRWKSELTCWIYWLALSAICKTTKKKLTQTTNDIKLWTSSALKGWHECSWVFTAAESLIVTLSNRLWPSPETCPQLAQEHQHLPLAPRHTGPAAAPAQRGALHHPTQRRGAHSHCTPPLKTTEKLKETCGNPNQSICKL